MDILQLQLKPGSVVYYDQAFRILLEDHMTYLKSLRSTTTLNIEPQKGNKYNGDLNGLLLEYNVRPELHYIVMRMNDLTSPSEYNESILSLLVPDEDEIARIRSSYKTKTKT